MTSMKHRTLHYWAGRYLNYCWTANRYSLCSSKVWDGVCIKPSNVYLTCIHNINSRFIIENKLISHNQELGVFTVLGTTGRPHAIRIFPKESCTCPSTGRCYHILAVKMSIGLEDIDSRRRVNLTQLRRNTRSRSQKKSGRKGPRPGDYEIVAAPDASFGEVSCWTWNRIYESITGHRFSLEVLQCISFVIINLSLPLF